MSPDLPPEARTRSAEELNERIRAFWVGPGGHPAVPLTAEQRAEYERLCDELWQVERGDVTTAA